MATCGETVIRLIEAYGIDTVFGIPGVHTVELYRGLNGSPIRHITPRHEQGAGMMACGYALATGRPAGSLLITGPGRLNPYKLGVELFRDIEERWNKGRFGKEYDECESIEKKRKWDTGLKKGFEKIFEVRRIHNDVTFIDEFLTPEFVDRYKLYHYRQDPATGRMVAVNRDFDQIKAQMLFMLTNHARPYIYVADCNYANRGELYLAHKHIGVDLEIRYAVECLKHLHTLWQRPVHLQAPIDDDMTLFTCEGDSVEQQKLNDDMPKPAHQLS